MLLVRKALKYELGVLNTRIIFATNYTCDLSCCIYLKQKPSLEGQSKREWILIFVHSHRRSKEIC